MYQQKMPTINKDQAYLAMVTNPCLAQLAYGPANGEAENGYLLRVNGRHTLHNVGTNTAGYVIWFPNWHNTGTGTTKPGGNCFYWENEPKAGIAPTIPTNSTIGGGSATTSIAYGRDSPSTPGDPTAIPPVAAYNQTTARVIKDPAYSWVNGTACVQARTLSACMNIQYVGALNVNQGLMGKVINIMPKQLIEGGSAGNATPMTVDDMLTFANVVDRWQAQKYELLHSPSEMGSQYRETDNPPVSNDISGNLCVLGNATPASTPTYLTLDGSKDNGIGFVWTSLPTTANDIQLVMTKIVEWTPTTITGISNAQGVARPVQRLDTLTQKLNNAKPGWQVKSSQPTTLQQVAQIAQTGAPNGR